MQALSPQVKQYITATVEEIRNDLYKMLSESPEKAIEAHYITLALNKIYAKIMTDINANLRATREVKK
jgi:hypothetical protein